MRDDNFYRSGVRSQSRKRKRADKILNISIGVVIFLILLVGGQLLLGGKASDLVVSNNNVEEDTNGDGSGDTTPSESDAEEKEVDSEEVAEKEEPSSTKQTPTTTEEQSDSEESTEQGSQNPPQTGQWKPIGTVQSEPFAAVYEKDHVNWEEMTRAFQVATGIGDDITLWRVGNGGDHLSSVGIVSNYATRTTPYKVRIEWVANEGWMPVSVEQLEENPYLPTTTTDATDEEETDSN